MRGSERPPEEVRRLKLERAARYAGAWTSALDGGSTPDGAPHLVVGVAGERLALDASAVIAVVAPGAVTPLPFTPPHVAGGTHFRGAPVLVVELHALAGQAWAASPGARDVLVSWPGGGEVALRVDEVLDVRPLAAHVGQAPAAHWLSPPVVRGLLEDGTSVIHLSALAASLEPGPGA